MARGRAGIADLRGPGLLNNPVELKAALADQARALGFDCVGVTTPDAIPQAAKNLRAFLSAGAHGDMDWLARDPDRRADPRGLWRDESGHRWLVPLAVFLCIFGVILILATTVEALAPFIYAIF